MIAGEITARRQRAPERRIKQAKLPKPKTLADYDFPKRVPKQKVLRLFDGEFVEQRNCAVLIGPAGTGKTRLLTALATAMIDRLMHHGEAIVIQGESYHTKDHSQAE